MPPGLGNQVVKPFRALFLFGESKRHLKNSRLISRLSVPLVQRNLEDGT